MRKANLHLSVYLSLLVLLLLTVWAARFDLGAGNIIIALAIAGGKAALVALFFMDLVDTEDLDAMAGAFALVMLAILFTLSLADVLTRGWFPI